MLAGREGPEWTAAGKTEETETSVSPLVSGQQQETPPFFFFTEVCGEMLLKKFKCQFIYLKRLLCFIMNKMCL